MRLRFHVQHWFQHWYKTPLRSEFFPFVNCTIRRMSSKFAETTKGKPAIALGGFLYRLKKIGETSKNWQCVNKYCNAKITTPLDSPELIHGTTSHNHVEDGSKVQATTLRQACKRKAEENIADRPRKILISEAERIGQDEITEVTQKNIDQVIFKLISYLQ